MSTSLFSKTPGGTVLDNRGLTVRNIVYHRRPDALKVTNERITRHQYDARGFLAQSADPRLHDAELANFSYLSALSGSDLKLVTGRDQNILVVPHQPFGSTPPEYCFPTSIAAKLAIAADLATPLAKLSAEDKAFIDQVLTDTLIRSEVFARVREYFRNNQSGEDHAG